MEKPYTLQIMEFERKLIDIINESNMPAFVIEKVLDGIYNQIVEQDQEEVRKYNQSNLEENQINDKIKEESDK